MAPKHGQKYRTSQSLLEQVPAAPEPEQSVSGRPPIEHVSRVHAPCIQGSSPAATRPGNDGHSRRSTSSAVPAHNTREAPPVTNIVQDPQSTMPGNIAVTQQSLHGLLASIQSLLQQSVHPHQAPSPQPPSATPDSSARESPQSPLASAVTAPSSHGPLHLHPAVAMRPCNAVATGLMLAQARHHHAPHWLHKAVIDPAALPRLKILTIPLNAIKAAYAKHYRVVTGGYITAEHRLAASDFLTVLQMNACSLSSQLDRMLALMPRLRRVAPPPGAPGARSRGAAVPAYFEWRRQFIEFLVFVAEALETYFLQRVHHGVLEYRRAVFSICRQLPRPLAAVGTPAVDLFNDNSVPVLDMLAALDAHFCPDQARAEEVCGMSLRMVRSDVKAKRLCRARGDCKIAEILDEFNAACSDVLR